VSDLSTEAFIASFKWFSAGRGFSSHMYSDCGTNFVGADRELKSWIQSSGQSGVPDFLADSGTTWHLNPAAAPHQEGLWEAEKSVKFHLKHVVGNSNLSIEEFQRILCLVEACLDSCPLCAISMDPAVCYVLTPGHFLIGHPLTGVSEPDLLPIPMNRLSRWQQTQQMSQHH